jgi:ubiquinol-cytochrome c reductase cytochrome c subunit
MGRPSLPLRLLVLATIGAGCAGLLMSSPVRAQGGEQHEPAGSGGQGEPAGDPALVEEGRRLYVEGCSSCHGADGKGSRLTGRVSAPTLIGVGAAAVDFYVSSGRMPAADTNIPQAVRKPPAYDKRQTAALVAYVTSLGPGGPPIPELDLDKAVLSRGADLYLLNCAACHNAAGVGGALSYGAFAPSLHPPTPTEIAEAMRVGPGNMPIFGPETISDEELNDIVRYVVYLQHPEDPGGAGLGHFGPLPEGFVGWLFGLGPLIGFTAWVGTRA